MLSISLPDEKTNAGVEMRVFFCETSSPHTGDYDLAEAMQCMDVVLYNRLANPGGFNAKGALNLAGIVRGTGQFTGFGSYPSLPGKLSKEIQLIMTQVNNGDPDYVTFYQNALKIANRTTKLHAPSRGTLCGWVSNGSKIKGGKYKFYKSLQGNDFYYVD
jgi:hypothetical protein